MEIDGSNVLGIRHENRSILPVWIEGDTYLVQYWAYAQLIIKRNVVVEARIRYEGIAFKIDICIYYPTITYGDNLNLKISAYVVKGFKLCKKRRSGLNEGRKRYGSGAPFLIEDLWYMEFTGAYSLGSEFLKGATIHCYIHHFSFTISHSLP